MDEHTQNLLDWRWFNFACDNGWIDKVGFGRWSLVCALVHNDMRKTEIYMSHCGSVVHPLHEVCTIETNVVYRAQALEMLEKLRRSKGAPCKKWRGVGYFGVPGAVMRRLAEEGLCETRKLSGHAPTEYRP